MGSIPLPALDLKPVQQPDPMGDVSKLMALKSMMTQQASQQQELQIRQQQIKDTQARTAAMKGLDPNSASYYDDLAKKTLENGGSADAATAIQQHGLTIKKTVSDIAKQDSETGSKNLETFTKKFQFIGDQLGEEKDIPDNQLHDWALSKVGVFQQGGILPTPQAQQLAQQIQQTQDPAHLRGLIQQTAKSAAGAKYVAEQAKTEAETKKDTAQGEEATATAANKRAESKFYTENGGAPGVPVDMLEMSDALKRGLIKNPSQWTAYKSKQEAAATLPYKIETSKAEGQARQLIQGMEKPVYGIRPDGTKELMSATSALQAGIHTMLPVTEKEVGEDTMLTNRLGDVRQKIARYEQALGNLGKSVSAKDQGNIAALIGKNSFKLGAFGSEMPLDRLNAALQRENVSGLSEDAKKLLVSYYNARESMQGYTRVLTGSGRSNEKAMELNLDALPNPGTTDKSYAAESMKQFKENLAIVGQGLPKIPGIKSPEEIEAETNGTTKTPAKASDPLGIR
jgi:predicted lactoylglutathione lyase